MFAKNMFSKRKTETNKSILDYYDDESYMATEFRRLVKNIKYYGNPTEVKSILVTSATKNEGKSLIAANLAITMAKHESDKIVLLIDCDLRRPVIQSLMQVKMEPGLSSILNGQRELSDVIQDTELDNLKVMTSGYVKGSPSQLIVKAQDVIGKFKSIFDIIICDAPPTVPVDDVSVLAPYVDGVLFVVMAGKTDKMVVKRAMDILNKAKATVLGIVLNNFYDTLPYYYNYGYYRYKYSKYNKNNGV